jgi:hypothetical protein
MMLIDEASRVDDEIYRALRPMLAVGQGDLWLLSTPYRKRGFFYRTWLHPGDEWHKVLAPVTECPRISQDWIEEERSQQRKNFAMDYMCEFQDDGQSLFSREAVERALDATVKPLAIRRLSSWPPEKAR